ncbi:endospore germination permease [Clostridium sp. YIM B02505]|uniref:Endospore germination permease n=1 Tax=Clostridium yunnanense TaxID=2800325 RepID=A0ABS1EQ07_9CLOT|nr:endospore germination permease [Clostridium yunnanense]MBK1811470.1 endospore germination permease [Clostridium yunnanense]
MENEVVCDKLALNTVILFVFGSTMILGAAGEAKNSSWLAIIAATILVIPLLLVYCRILYLFPKKDIFDIFPLLYGKYVGKFLCVIYIWYFFHLGALVIRNFAEFMNTLALPETPMIVTIMCLSLLCIWSSTHGVEVMARTSRILLIICITFVFIIASLVISQMRFHYLKPFFDLELSQFLNGTFSAFSFPFAEVVVFTGVFSCLERRTSSYKVLIKGVVIASAFIVYISMRNIMVLGPSTLKLLYFPSYVAISRIHLGEFIQRVEVSVAIVFVSAIFIKVSICLIATSNGISKLFGLKDYKSLIIQTGLLMSYLAYILYDSTMEMQYWALSVYKYYAFPFQVIIPVVTLILAHFKIKKTKQASCS